MIKPLANIKCARITRNGRLYTHAGFCRLVSVKYIRTRGKRWWTLVESIDDPNRMPFALIAMHSHITPANEWYVTDGDRFYALTGGQSLVSKIWSKTSPTGWHSDNWDLECILWRYAHIHHRTNPIHPDSVRLARTVIAAALNSI